MKTKALTKGTEHALTSYLPLEKRITKGDLDALLARWEFGKRLLEERGDKKQLPAGRVKQVWHACHTSTTEVSFRSELSRRMRFAEQYPSEAKQLRHACLSSSTAGAFHSEVTGMHASYWTEFSRRMRFAEQYPSEAKVRAVFKERGR